MHIVDAVGMGVIFGLLWGSLFWSLTNQEG